MRDMAAQMPGGMPGMAMPGQSPAPGQQDFHKILLGEKENLQLTPHKWELDDVEVKVLEKYGKRTVKKAKEARVSTKKEVRPRVPGSRMKRP